MARCGSRILARPRVSLPVTLLRLGADCAALHIVAPRSLRARIRRIHASAPHSPLVARAVRSSGAHDRGVSGKLLTRVIVARH